MGRMTIKQRKIAYWPITCMDDAISLLQYVIENWKSSKDSDSTGIYLKINHIYTSDKKNTYIEFSTMGIKANKNTIEALEMNKKFWELCWYKSVVGRHYHFELKEI